MYRIRQMRLLLLPLILFFAAGCTSDKFELFVDVRSELSPGVDFDAVETVLLADEARPALRSSTSTVGAADDFAAGHRVADFSDIEAGAYVLRVSLLLESAVVQSQRLLVQINSDRAVTVSFEAACSGVVCPGPDDPATATECSAGMCIDPPTTCENAAQCPLIDCSSASCEGGVCRYRPVCDGGMDAAMDADTPDASDSGSTDSGPSDTGGGTDTGDADAGTDAAADSAADVGRTPLLIESAALGTPTGLGITISSLWWVGWRFEVPAPGMVVTEVGLNASTDDDGSMFLALVALTGPTDTPDSADLTTGDRVALATFVPGTSSASRDVSTPLSAVLSAGWYAIVAGTGAHGATLGMGRVPDGHVMTSGADVAFSLNQSDGRLIPQAGDRRFFIRGYED